jgi:predicted transcriptional regulator
MIEQIRRYILLHPEAARELLVSKRQAAIILSAAVSPVTTAIIAKRYDTSVQSAFATLEKCRSKGYLTREQKDDPTGGKFFLYKACTIARTSAY